MIPIGCPSGHELMLNRVIIVVSLGSILQVPKHIVSIVPVFMIYFVPFWAFTTKG